jgi:MoxR-like ATPase
LFFVIATQNPVEFRGTYPLPEAQMDRFAMQCTLGYVTAAEEAAILADQAESHPVDTLTPVATREEIVELMNLARHVRFSEELRHYVVALVGATRGHPSVQLAASPRASLALMKVSQALAVFQGDDFVSPELIQSVAADVIAHRMVLAPEAKYSGSSARRIIAEIIEQIPVPV